MSWAPGDHPRDDLAAYALDALEGDERAALEAHVATCPECQDDLVAYRETLALAVEDEAPPPDLWDRVVDAIDAGDAASDEVGPGRAPGDRAAEAAPVVPLGPPPSEAPVSPVPPVVRRPDEGIEPGGDRPRHLKPREPRRRLVALVAAAAVVLAAVVGGAAAWDRLRDDDTTEVVAPDLPRGTIAAEDGTPVARVEADAGGSFVDLSDAAPLPADRTYQLWSLDGPQPVALGLLGSGGDDDVPVALPEGTTQVAISDEPAGGSPQPTGPIVGTGTLALPS